MKETEKERQEIVRKYTQLRREKLKNDIIQSKTEFSTQLMQVH